MSESLASLQQQMEVELQDIDKIQKEITKLYQARQGLYEKKNENDLVLDEFKLLDDSANVYKLIGPVLAKQEFVEAKSNVEKRLEFINKEVYAFGRNKPKSESRQPSERFRREIR